jgi:hypothetical protein
MQRKAGTSYSKGVLSAQTRLGIKNFASKTVSNLCPSSFLPANMKRSFGMRWK